MNKTIIFLLLLIAVLFQSCAHYTINTRQKVYKLNSGYRFDRMHKKEQDSTFVVLAFSGGGTRAAAFSYGLLKQLDKIKLPYDRSRSFLDEVDLITAVSGGSFTAAYYGLYGKKIFKDFKTKFLDRDIQGELTKKLLNPYNWLRLMSPYYSRIDLAYELYNETVFDKKTFSDLEKSQCPAFVVVNATNLYTGSPFTFTQRQMDIFGTDLSKMPLAKAVAASSAYPFLLSPVTLNNYNCPEGYRLPSDIKNGLKDCGINNSRYLWAKNRCLYFLQKEKHPYVHLMDGGLSDNIGLRFVLNQYMRSSGIISKRKRYIKQLLVIVVDAKNQSTDLIDTHGYPPGLKEVALKTANISIDNYSFDTVEILKNSFEEHEKAVKIIKRSGRKGMKFTDYKTCLVNVNFYKIRDKKRRKWFLNMPTNFSLESHRIDALVNEAGNILMESVEFKKLINEMTKNQNSKMRQ